MRNRKGILKQIAKRSQTMKLLRKQWYRATTIHNNKYAFF